MNDCFIFSRRNVLHGIRLRNRFCESTGIMHHIKQYCMATNHTFKVEKNPGYNKLNGTRGAQLSNCFGLFQCLASQNSMSKKLRVQQFENGRKLRVQQYESGIKAECGSFKHTNPEIPQPNIRLSQMKINILKNYLPAILNKFEPSVASYLLLFPCFAPGV